MEDEILEILAEVLEKGVVEIEECGCVVELDGVCPHGNESPLLEACLI